VSPISASISGAVTLGGAPVQGARVSIYTDQSLTTVPAVRGRPTSARGNPVFTAGTGPVGDEVSEGAYCISQLPPSQTYWIRATDADGLHGITLSVAVGTGWTPLAIALTP
jgi:hypothetical protein